MGHQHTIIATFSEGTCERTMESLDKTLYEVHEWARMRIATLTHSGNKEINALDEKCIREEFREWLDCENDEEFDIFSLEYIGEGSKYD